MRRWYQIKSTETGCWAFLFWHLLLWPALLNGPVGWRPAIAEAAGEADRNYYAFRYLSRPEVPPVRQIQRAVLITATPISAPVVQPMVRVTSTMLSIPTITPLS